MPDIVTLISLPISPEAGDILEIRGTPGSPNVIVAVVLPLSVVTVIVRSPTAAVSEMVNVAVISVAVDVTAEIATSGSLLVSVVPARLLPVIVMSTSLPIIPVDGLIDDIVGARSSGPVPSSPQESITMETVITTNKDRNFFDKANSPIFLTVHMTRY